MSVRCLGCTWLKWTVSLPLPASARVWSSSLLGLMGVPPCFLEVQCPETLSDPVIPAPVPRPLTQLCAHCPPSSLSSRPLEVRQPGSPFLKHLSKSAALVTSSQRVYSLGPLLGNLLQPNWPLKWWGHQSLPMGPHSVPTPVPWPTGPVLREQLKLPTVHSDATPHPSRVDVQELD